MDGGLKFDYYYGIEAEQFSFYRVPRLLIKDVRFKGLSSDAKLLYGLMLDRMALSMKNGWLDEENRAYIHYTVENIMEDLGCARATCVKVLAELDSKKGIGLIEKKRQGLGKPDIIYVKNFVVAEQDTNSQNKEKKPDDTDVSTEVQNLNFKKFKNQTSGSSESEISEIQKPDFQKSNNQTSRSSENELQEIQKPDFQRFKKQTSGSSENELAEVQKPDSNYNNINYTDSSYTNPIYPSTDKQQKENQKAGEMDRIEDDTETYIQIIRKNIEYDHYMKYNEWKDKALYDELYISLYMDRFDTLYEQGKMDHLLPTKNQKHIIEDIDFAEWENPYINFSREEIAEKEAVSTIQEEPKKKQEEKEKIVTLTVAECGEFHNFGEYHENIKSVDKAIAAYNRIPPERMNGIPSIGIKIHTKGTEDYEDIQMDIFSSGIIDLEILDYVPDITGNPKAMEVIAELVEKIPEAKVYGSLEKWQSKGELHTEADGADRLAAEIDRFSYEYDTTQYNEVVEDREAQVENIAADIRSGNTAYLNDFLNAAISEEIRVGITDIFGQGTEIEDSEAVQTARKAKELLDRLAEYKPLAKVEELEEANYNMIDGVLNNGVEKKEEHLKGRISVKEKLAEKKVVIEQKSKGDKPLSEKGAEKRSQREM